MRILKDKDAENFLEKEGFPVIKRKLVKTLEQAKKFAEEVGYPIAIKNPSILHKTEKGVVIIDVTKDNIDKMFKKLNAKQTLVQRQFKGKEILIGLKKDPNFGHVVAFGMGGIFTELIKDVSLRVCPITDKEVNSMIKEINGYNILKGVRGKKPVNMKIIKGVLLKTSKLAEKYPKIKELDINPLIINDKEGHIVDARIIFE